MPLCHETAFPVFAFECDPFGRMTPGAVLRRMQQIAVDQCAGLGVDEEYYRQTGTAFLVSRLSLQVRRMPGAAARVRLQTRAYGTRRAQYHRVSTLYAENGEALCEADTRWVLVSVAERRILRRPPPGPIALHFSEAPAEEHPLRMAKPEEEPLRLAQMRAACTLCDTNGHVNNACYADFVYDHLPIGRLREGPPARMLFNYHSEIPLGTDFSFWGAPLPGDGWYFQAKGETVNYFEATVEFHGRSPSPQQGGEQDEGIATGK